MRHQEFKLYSILCTHTTLHTCDMELFLTFATDNNSIRSAQWHNIGNLAYFIYKNDSQALFQESHCDFLIVLVNLSQ
jgi:hypothetical protein